MATRALSSKLLRTPGGRAFAVFLALLALFLIYGRLNFYRDPLSIFYDPEHAQVRWYSAFREAQANAFIEQAVALHRNDAVFKKAGPRPRVCASFLTTKREGLQYIEASIGSALEGLTEAERDALYLAVFFTNSDPFVHPTWQYAWLRNLLDDVYTYNVTEEEFEQIRDWEARKAFGPKGVYDYTYALEHCLNQGAEWVVIFEGDIILAHGWLVKMLDGLRQIREALHKQTGEWLFMRLFNQERSTGWWSTEIGGHNEFWISLGIGSVVAAALLAIRPRSQFVSRHVDNWALTVICCIAVPTFVVLFFQAGKASMLPPSPGVRQESFGCCSQAMVFPREQVAPTVQYLWARKQGQVDLMLNDHSRATGLARIALYPVQVQHIGISSARGTTTSDAQAIWSMAFEDLNPRSLQREHDRLVKQIFGS